MSLFWLLHSPGTAIFTPTAGGETPPVPLVSARIAWRPEDFEGVYTFSALAWDGASTASWVIDGSGNTGPASSISTTSSDSFGGGSCLEMVTGGTADSGVDFALGTASFTSGREYRFRVGLRSVSGDTSTVLRLGNGADYATSTATVTTGWAWYTVDWTPSGDRTDVTVSLANGAAATQTTRFDHAEVYEKLDEVTLDSLTVTRGSRFDGTREAPGKVDFTVLDPDDVYTPRNSASTLYGYVRPGRKVHIRATYGGKLYPVAYGIVRSVDPDPLTRSVRFTCEDGLAELEQYSVEREFAFSGSFRTARAAALSAEALGTAQHSLATDSTEAAIFPDGTDDETVLLDYLDDLNEATGTVHFCKPHVEAVRPWRYTTMTRATLTNDDVGTTIDEDFQRLSDVDSRDESFITEQAVRWQGYEAKPSQTVAEAVAALPYWTFTSEEYGSSERPEPEDIYRLKLVKGKKKRKRRKLRKVGSRWVDASVPIAIAAGGTAVEVVDFSVPMESLAATVTAGAGLTTTLTKEPARLTITMVAGGTADTVTDISVTAKPYIPLDEAEAQATATGAVITREGRRIDNQYIASAGAAEGMADHLTWRYGTARLRPSVTDQHHPVRQLTLDVGSHVTLSADRWYIDADRYLVRSIEHEVSRGGYEWETTYGLEELPASGSDGDWVLIDGGPAAGIDSSAVLAH